MDSTIIDNGGDGQDPTPQALMASGNVGASAQSRETMITNPPTIEYGLPYTHTTILPSLSWCSAGLLSSENSRTISLRMNSFFDILSTNGHTIASTVTNDNLYRKMFNREDYTLGDARGNAIPNDQWGSGLQCQWQEYYTKLYKYYTVLGCEYEITIQNASQAGRNILGAYSMQSYSEDANTNVLKKGQKIEEVQAFKNINWFNIESTNYDSNSNAAYILKGRYVPGAVQRDVENDGDVKTWKLTDNTGSGTNYNEILQIHLWRHPLSSLESVWATQPDGLPKVVSAPPHTLDEATRTTQANIQIRLKYLVQFKQLKDTARFPTSALALPTIVLTLAEDALQY